MCNGSLKHLPVKMEDSNGCHVINVFIVNFIPATYRQKGSTVEIVIVERKKKLTFILCLLEFKTITTCDIENLTAQKHGLYNCHQVVKDMVCHVTVTFYHFCFQ